MSRWFPPILTVPAGGLESVTAADVDSEAASDGHVLTADGAGGAAWEAAAGGGGLFDAYALLRDEKAANTHGGTPGTGSFQKHDLATEVFDSGGIVSVASSVFTLQAGTYFIRAWAACYQTDRFKLKIRNTSDGADAIIGGSNVSTGGGNDGSVAVLTGRITIAAAKNFELQYRAENAGGGTRGLGVESNYGVAEVYAEVEIWREAA